MIGFTSKDGQQSKLWKRLEKERVLSKDRFRDAVKQAKQEDRHFVEVLFEDASLPQEKLLDLISDFYQAPSVLLRDKVISPFVLSLIPKEVAEEHSVVVFKKIQDVIHVATTNPENTQTIEFIKKKTGFEPKVFLTTPEEIRQALKKYGSEISTEFAKMIEEGTREALAIHESAEKVAEYVPIVQMVNTIVEQALSQNASDIHFEPGSDILTIRFRIDGILQRIVDLPKAIAASLVTRIKILSNLKIDEHRIPQDGRFRYDFRGREVAVRVSAVPTLHGAKVVLRLLDAKGKQFTLSALGLNHRDAASVKKEIMKPYGMILVTGPTGSGKTTTLYTVLRMLNKEGVNICTIEDPIEYGVEGISQTQVNVHAGLTFSNGLRSLLRQDPNIIMVGEIRDADTADISVNAAMTGHLVLSTLHTNNAFLVPQRLTEMGVEPFLSSSVINIVIGQRLVRKICTHCRRKVPSRVKYLERFRPLFDLEGTFRKLKHYGLVAGHDSLLETSLYHGRGCSRCNGTGYLGRVGIYEILPFDEALTEQIMKDRSADAVQRFAGERGILTMFDDGVAKVLNGVTTFEEVLRVTKE